MIYTVSIEGNFSSAHAIRGYKGKCERLHGHNWKVQASISGKKLDRKGMLVDFGEIKLVLNNIIKKLDHQNINRIPPFNKINPTAENIAAYILNQMRLKIKSLKVSDVDVSEVKVWESETSFASVSE